jgi:hypothetical protein
MFEHSFEGWYRRFEGKFFHSSDPSCGLFPPTKSKAFEMHYEHSRTIVGYYEPMATHAPGTPGLAPVAFFTKGRLVEIWILIYAAGAGDGSGHAINSYLDSDRMKLATATMHIDWRRLATRVGPRGTVYIYLHVRSFSIYFVITDLSCLKVVMCLTWINISSSVAFPRVATFLFRSAAILIFFLFGKPKAT